MEVSRKSDKTSEQGVVSIEFVLVIFAILATVFFVIEVTLYLFFSASVHKAAQSGARALAVSAPVVDSFPIENERSANGVFGVDCADQTSPCIAFTQISCTGNACNSDFTRIFNHMSRFNGQILPQHVTVSYGPTGLGFAGGPTIPLVTVTVTGVPFRAGFTGLLLNSVGIIPTLPTHIVSTTGEDLSNGAAE